MKLEDIKVNFNKQTVPDRGSPACPVLSPCFILYKHGLDVGCTIRECQLNRN